MHGLAVRKDQLGLFIGLDGEVPGGQYDALLAHHDSAALGGADLHGDDGRSHLGRHLLHPILDGSQLADTLGDPTDGVGAADAGGDLGRRGRGRTEGRQRTNTAAARQNRNSKRTWTTYGSSLWAR